MAADKLDIAALILKGSQALDDAEGFSIDRSKYLNASSCLTCIRKQWYDRKFGDGQQDWGYARRGKQGELYMVDCLEAGLKGTGWLLSAGGEDQVSIVSEEHRISATPDGYLEHEDGRSVGLEFKTVDPRTNTSNLPKKQHVVQLQIGMEIDALQEDGGECDYGIIVYMDASNYNTLHTFRVERDPGILDRLAPRAKKLLNAKSDSNLDREGRKNGECQAYGGCPYRERCGVEVEGQAKVTRGNKGSNLDSAVQTYVIAKGDEELAKAAKNVAAEEIKQELLSRNVTDLQVGNHVISLTKVAGRTTCDWKAAEKDGINMDPYKKVGPPSERLTVK